MGLLIKEKDSNKKIKILCKDEEKSPNLMAQ
jgi:hypothetical protein